MAGTAKEQETRESLERKEEEQEEEEERWPRPGWRKRDPFYALICARSVSGREFTYIVRLNPPFSLLPGNPLRQGSRPRLYDLFLLETRRAPRRAGATAKRNT